jgi:hypothetical protein
MTEYEEALSCSRFCRNIPGVIWKTAGGQSSGLLAISKVGGDNRHTNLRYHLLRMNVVFDSSNILQAGLASWIDIWEFPYPRNLLFTLQRCIEFLGGGRYPRS